MRRGDRGAVKLAFCVLTASALGCGGSDAPIVVSPGTGDTGSADSGSVLPTCSPDNPLCGDAGVPLPPSACGSAEITLETAGVNVMFAVDGSQIMAAHWSTMQAALKTMLEENPTLNFGAQIFWGELNRGDFDRVNACGDVVIRHLAPAPGQANQVLQFLGPQPPGPGNDFFSLRAVVDPLNYHLRNDTGLTNPDFTNYLVLVSSGDDNCFGTAFAGDEDKYLAYEKLAVELLKKNIRVLPIGFDAASSQVAWVDGGVSQKTTDYRALDTLAVYGGAGLKGALAADSTEGLAEAIRTVSRAVRSCRFRVPDDVLAAGTDGFRLELFVNGSPVPRDRTHAQALGWDFVAGDASQVEMFNQACEAIQAGKPIVARPTCATDICGTAAAKIEPALRAVEFLVDASASMANCSKPNLACLLEGELTWWGVAARTIAKSVVSTVNDDVEFGLQYFPSRGGELGSCEVGPDLAVDISGGSEIAVIGSVLATLPTGATPLVAGLEQVAQAPGRLAEAGLKSALIVVSDGGNSCGGLSTEEAVQRLSVAAASLRERGIAVYALRLGDKGADFADQDAQLRAIAINGGTAPTDKSATPYLEAPDEATLNATFEELFDTFAECKLSLGQLGDDVDTKTTNLYINGESKPFDASGTRTGGWGWSDTVQGDIVMYGATCDEFKASRSSSIVVEFGCPQIILR